LTEFRSHSPETLSARNIKIYC